VASVASSQHMLWLSGVMIGCQTHDQECMGSTACEVAIKWLLLGWVSVCRRTDER